MRQQDYARAIDDFDRAVRLKPSFDNYMLRAKALEADGKFDKALADYQRATWLAADVPNPLRNTSPKTAPSPPLRPLARPSTPLNAMTAQAGIWRKKQEADKAIAIYNRAVLADQNHAGTYALRAETYMAMGDNKHAMDDISRALKFSWRASFLKTRGKLRLETGDIAGTIHDADAMLKIDADDNTAYALRGAALVRKKDYARALPDLDRAIKADGKNALAYSARGEAYFAKHDTDRALADFNQAVELGAKNADLYRARAAINKAKGNTDAAIADFTQAIRHGAEPADFFQRAALYKAKGDTDKVLGDLDAGLQRQPGNLDALRLRAEVERANGDLNGAIADYGAVLKRAPKDTAILRARADARIAGKDMTGAIADLDTLVKLSPRDLKTRYERGTVQEQNGDFAKAIEDYKFVLAHNRRAKEARAALKRSVLAQRKAEQKAREAARRKTAQEAAEKAAQETAQETARKADEKTAAVTGAIAPIADAEDKPAGADKTAEARQPSAVAAIPEKHLSRAVPENSGDIVATPLPRARPRAPLVREARETPEPDIKPAAPAIRAQPVPRERHATPLPAPRRHAVTRQPQYDRRAEQARRYRLRQAELARQFHADDIRRYRAEQARRYRAAQARRQPRYYRAGSYDVRRTRDGYVIRRRAGASFNDAFR